MTVAPAWGRPGTPKAMKEQKCTGHSGSGNFSPNIIFLIIIWEFHIMYPAHSSQVYPNLVTPQKRKEKLKNLQVQFVLPIYTPEGGHTPRG